MPREGQVFALLSAQARIGVEAADHLAVLVGAASADRPALASTLADIEQRGDEAAHQVFHELARSFVTPFGRDELHALAEALDECTDHLDDAGQSCALYRIEWLPDGVAELLNILARMARVTADAMPALGRPTDLAGFWVEVNGLENRANQARRRALLESASRQVATTQELLAARDVIAALDRAADAFERVAHVVRRIALLAG